MQSELIGQNLFDFIHHKDVTKVKDQLATNEHLPKERYIDSKTMKLIKTRLPQAHLQLRSGGRRLFVCRIKKNASGLNDTAAAAADVSSPSAASLAVQTDVDLARLRAKRKPGQCGGHERLAIR